VRVSINPKSEKSAALDDKLKKLRTALKLPIAAKRSRQSPTVDRIRKFACYAIRALFGITVSLAVISAQESPLCVDAPMREQRSSPCNQVTRDRALFPPLCLFF